ncbi:MAG: hypothetical protein IJU25_01925 [Lachnospiraceae bacterium]|nr:hypothetical protein [Lachnospiraceae bacterium]
MKWNTVMNDICGLFKLAKSQTTSTKYAMAQAVEMDARPILPTEPITLAEKAEIDDFLGKYRQYLVKT